MLIRRKELEGIRNGTIARAYRRWRRPTVKAGGTLKTAIGVLAIDAVEPVALGKLTLRDARAAGAASLDALRAELRQREGTVYRIDLRYVGADPRIALRTKSRLSRAELNDVLERIAHIDGRSRRGPWTRDVLALLHDQPGVRAGDLASRIDRERLAFKRDVRKLKELGLTESLEVGYRLSPRGKAVLRALDKASD